VFGSGFRLLYNLTFSSFFKGKNVRGKNGARGTANTGFLNDINSHFHDFSQAITTSSIDFVAIAVSLCMLLFIMPLILKQQEYKPQELYG